MQLPRSRRLAQVMRIAGVEVYVHWSVFLIAAVMLLGVLERPALTFVALGAYFSVLLIHECGHMIAARRKGCRVLCIEIYPLWGITEFEVPWSRLDHCTIAWGGVVAQLAIALPLVAWVVLFGYTRFEPVNAVLAILGGFSLGVAVFNLIPVAPLDGALAWNLLPELIKRRRSRRQKRQAAGWRS